MGLNNNLFVMRYNRRDDDLGDQFILYALAESLADFGRVAIRNETPEFLSGVATDKRGIKSKLTRLSTRCQGGTIFDVLPPGAILRPNPKVKRVSKPRIPGLSLEGTRISLGRSVIPDADHSWCQRVDWIGVRDNASIEALKAAGYRHVTYFPDLAFMVQPANYVESREYSNRFGFSFRAQVPEDNTSEDYENRLAPSVAAFLESTGTNAVGYHQVEEDAKYVRRICEDFGLVRQEHPVTLNSYQDFYRELDFVVSNRLHCLLMGALCGALPIALTTSEHTKIVSLYKTIGWDSLLICAESPEQAPERIAQIQNQASVLRTMVAKTLDEQRELGKQVLKSLVVKKGRMNG